MPRFRKKIVTAKVHPVGRLDGSEAREAITPERIKGWVENSKKLKELGVLIPAPFAHQDKNHKIVLPVIKGEDGETLADAYSGLVSGVPAAWDLAHLNAGFWEDFSQDEEGSLIGEVDSPGDLEDETTYAGKISKTVKQTSVLVMPGRKIIGKDGQEHEIGEHLAHVALCLHAQENGQSNFEPLSTVPDAMAMSFVLAMDDITGIPDPNKPKDEELYSVITLLRSALNVALPEETSRENFLQSLKLVLTQKLADQREKQTEQSVTQRPQDGQSKSPSIAMSATNQPTANTAEAILMSMLNKSKKTELRDRVKKLIETGRIGKEYAEKTLFPKIDAFAMSAADIDSKTGEFAKSTLEDLIEGLEGATPLVGPSVLEQGLEYGTRPDGSYTQDFPRDVITGQQVEDMSDAQMDALLDQSGVGTY